MIVINSGAYTHQELSAEFGMLPPAFLPVGLTRLYELQARMFAGLDGDLHLTLPESFDLPAWDEARLDELGFTVLRTPDDMTLGAALLHGLGRIGFSDRPLKLLHGDTLLDGVDLIHDSGAAVAQGRDGYRWAHVAVDSSRAIVKIDRPDLGDDGAPKSRLCGYFAFGDAARFAARLALARGDFYDALNAEAAAQDFRALDVADWHDFGHVQTYFRSRRIITTARAFNSLLIGERSVRKRSATAAPKLKAEARWLRDAPPVLRPFCARLLDEGEDDDGYFYDTEYEYMPTLSELYVFGGLSAASWSGILSSCSDYLEASVEAGAGAPANGLLERMVVRKTQERLTDYAQAANLDLDAPNTLNGRPAPSLRACLDDIASILAGSGDRPSVMHGDFCFSNILYSFRTDRVRVIDPRGLTETGEFSLFGDLRYDLAKLMHSIVGRYDLIIAGRHTGGRTGRQDFELAFHEDRNRLQVEKSAEERIICGEHLGGDVVCAVMTSLFLSMGPLHADRPDRQGAFIANALRLRLAIDQRRP